MQPASKYLLAASICITSFAASDAARANDLLKIKSVNTDGWSETDQKSRPQFGTGRLSDVEHHEPATAGADEFRLPQASFAKASAKTAKVDRLSIGSDSQENHLEAEEAAALKLYGYTGYVNLPRTGIGFQRNGPLGSAPELFGGRTNNQVMIYGGTGILHVAGLFVGFNYFEGHEDNSFDIPSGIDSGVVFGQLSPSGSSGIATNRGLLGQTRTKFNGFNISAGLPIIQKKDRFSLAGYAKYSDYNRDISGWAYYMGAAPSPSPSPSPSPTPTPSISFFEQHRDQSVDDSLFELGVKGKFKGSLGDKVEPFILGSAGVYYRDSDLNSLERNTSNIGPSIDQNFEVQIDDSDDGVGFHGSIGAGINYKFSDKFSVGIGASLDYYSDLGAVFNPNSGDQVFFDGLSTELRSQDAFAYRFGIGTRFRF